LENVVAGSIEYFNNNTVKYHIITFTHENSYTALARFSERNSVRPSVRLSVHYMGGSVKNGAS